MPKNITQLEERAAVCRECHPDLRITSGAASCHRAMLGSMRDDPPPDYCCVDGGASDAISFSITLFSSRSFRIHRNTATMSLSKSM
jgi:hypothetical protein